MGHDWKPAKTPSGKNVLVCPSCRASIDQNEFFGMSCGDAEKLLRDATDELPRESSHHSWVKHPEESISMSVWDDGVQKSASGWIKRTWTCSTCLRTGSALDPATLARAEAVVAVVEGEEAPGRFFRLPQVGACDAELIRMLMGE